MCVGPTYKLEEGDKVVGQRLVHDELAIEVLNRAGGRSGHVDGWERRKTRRMYICLDLL